MSGDLVDLSPGQLHKLADLIHRQEVQKLQELEFNSYAEQQKYLRDANDARDKVYHILDSARDMIAQTEAEKDATKQDIGKDVYDYCTKAIGISLQFIRSYNTRLTYLDKLKTHSDDLIKQLKFLNPATQQKEAQRLALEAGMYKKATLENAKKFQHFAPNQFSKWLKENKIMFEDLVQENMSKLGFRGAFKNLDDIQKLQVYDNIIAEAGQGKSVVTYSFEALGKVGVAVLVFTAAAMVWDIYTAEDKLEAAVRDSVNALTAVVNLEVGEIVTTAVEAGFVALDIEIASAAVTVIGGVVGFGIGALIGIAAGALLDLIFSSGTSKVEITDGLTVCRVAPMPHGLELARLVKHNYPEL
ncbi:uncharacterized protein LOC123441232 [Hordeum vulgare subsp. vulgare]|uniref:Uncharacterized protein n=1 Tax=Hordeum vulgare subsp. vulgare TaxID=112509 RepID=A0A8I6XDN5_HORVV|nr:uncharacterized protein LOC123441226 [Hordeum vulgare subsp. vulgare]XP_044973654.1 uncharacterized protein LOC123441228 [Hordeum vulgare subsp. vulgare]XP_044973658.1 uncharacterized protein LOC123441232 [Hordeum vulgare subsp. vulgare]